MVGSDRGLMGILSWNLLERTEENHVKPPVRIADVPAQIPREHILNISSGGEWSGSRPGHSDAGKGPLVPIGCDLSWSECCRAQENLLFPPRIKKCIPLPFSP